MEGLVLEGVRCLALRLGGFVGLRNSGGYQICGEARDGCGGITGTGELAECEIWIYGIVL